MHRNVRNTGWVWVVALGLLPGAATSQEAKNAERGFQPERSFDLGEIDHVNNFNGNLVVSLPIGPRYQVSPQLSYQFALTWNSNVWDLETDLQGFKRSYPNRISDAGIGWYFGLGRLIQPGQPGNTTAYPVYVGADGRKIRFYATLHPEDGDESSENPAFPNTQATLYSRDGSYARLRRGGNCQGGQFPENCDWSLDLGDVTSTFRYGDGLMTSMSDRFGNFVTIAMTPTAWTITDPFRTQTVNFAYKTLDDNQLVPMVTSVALAAFGGTTATYTFNYSTVTSIHRPEDALDSAVDVTFLASITGPSGTGWTLAMPLYEQSPDPAVGLQSGTLQKVTLPTGGAIGWTYQTYETPTGEHGLQTPKIFRSIGVAARTKYQASGATEGVWTYLAEDPVVALRTCDGTSEQTLPVKTLTRTAVTPLGDKTVRYFTVFPCGLAGYPFLAEMGLPYSSEAADVDAASGAKLSEQIFDCTANPSDPGNPTNCSLKRSTFLDYEWDNLAGAGSDDNNQRLVYRKTIYADDANHWQDVTSSDFDGLGHYRQTATNGNFDAGNVHTSFTNYNPGQSYPGGFTPIQPTAPWLLGLFDRVDETEGGDTSRRLFVFQSSSGFLDCVRTLKTSTTKGANDLLTRYTLGNDVDGNSGFVTQERFYGGDRQTIGTSGACSNGTTAETTIDHTYQFGARKTSKYAAVTWKILDLLIDPNSGQPSSSFDAAGMETSFVYDKLGRLTQEKPLAKSGFAKEAWSKYVYTLGSSSNVSIERCKSTSGGCTGSDRLTEAYVDFDDFGRVWQEGRRLPGGSFNIRRTLYDVAGNRSQVSTFKDSATGSFIWTTFAGYDPFGRPASVTAPDGETTSFTRLGDRTVETTQAIALALSGDETNVKRKETYDRQGRLFRVEEFSNPSAPTSYVKTEYGYDEAGRLTRVCQKPGSGSSCGQERLFSYDNRGFLTSEKHPEKGAAGNGFVYFKTYDSRGNVWKKRDGVDDTSRELNLTYDAADRVLSVANSGGTVLEQFVYDTATGKLTTAVRRNDLPAPWSANYQVTESYSYQEQMGRPSQRTTALAINGVPQESWSFTTGYHELGLVDALDYPECTGTGCTAHSDEPLAVDFTYEDGLITAIPGWTWTSASPAIGYHPNLQVASMAHGNGMTVTIANDPDRIPRPRSITVEAKDDVFQTFPAWESGDYLYDGAGNVKSIGADQYKYDKVSRLVDSNLSASALGRSQGYTFDLYGNLTSKTTDSVSISFPISASTNRFTTGSSYDAAGNQTAYNANGYGFDLLNTMTALCTGSSSLAACPAGSDLWGYVYTAEGERVLALRRDGVLGASDLEETWTLRDFGNRVLRRDEWIEGSGEQQGTGTSSQCPPEPNPIYCQNFESGTYLDWDLIVSGPTGAVKDYVWRGEKLFASTSTHGGARHFALDHLGTIRLVTDDFGQVAEEHAYFPFGEEATTNTSAEPMRFTGHERDLQSTPLDAADDLDYMHARFCSPLTGRFTSADQGPGSPGRPQSWNRYAYAFGNPLHYVDPDGLRAKSYTWGLYKFVLDSTHHGGPHVDVFTKKGALLGRVSRGTGQLIQHKGLTGAVPNTATKYMQSRGWIPGVALVVGVGIQMFFQASPADASEIPGMKEEIAARGPLNDLIAQVAFDLFGGPRTAEGLTPEQREQVMIEIEQRAEQQEQEAGELEQKRRQAEESLGGFIAGGCSYHGICQ